jgi:hypothetical protein
MSEKEFPPIGSFPLFLGEALELLERVTRKPPLPVMLHHYTTADGLLGILRTEHIWASNVRYMNDASELEYARKLISEELRFAIERCSGHLNKWLSEFPAVLERVFAEHEAYAACFCESGDLLSQWRAYGSSGFALGFTAEPFSRLEAASVLRVEYDQEVQHAVVRKTIDIHLAEMGKVLAAKTTGRIPEISAQFSLMLALWTAAFKHPAFAEEREWRIIPIAQITPVHFRNDRGWIKPYLEIPLADGDSGMALRSITHAPSPNPELTKRTLKLLLSDAKYAEVSICGSTVPLRV